MDVKKDNKYIAPVQYPMSNEGIRAYIRPKTTERLARFVPVKMGQSVDEYLNELADALESGKVTLKVRGHQP